MSELFAIGGDVSKGHLDVVILDHSGQALPGSGSYDDTHAGHTRLITHVRALARAHPTAEIRVAVEATGGYERNWLQLFRQERRRGAPLTCWRLNPLAVKRWLDSDLHRAVTDAHAAHGIATFLLARAPTVTDPEPTPTQTLYRQVRSTITERATVMQQLGILLGQVHPELVQYTRHGIPAWLLAVLEAYPTAAKVARAHPGRLAAMPHVGSERAQRLIASAQTSVASLTGRMAELSMALLVERIRTLTVIIDRYQAAVLEELALDPRVALIDSIPGIGTWTAVCLLLEIGDVARFGSSRQLIAWSGMDVHEDASGDGLHKRGISKRGNAHVRALLYMPAKNAITFNPVIARFHQRLRSRGKPYGVALTAAMAKLLRLVYAALTTGKPFDPDHEGKRHHRMPSSDTGSATTGTADLAAPVSRRQARKRRLANHKAAAPVAPCTGSTSQEATGTDRQTSHNTAADPAKREPTTPAVAGRHAGAMRPTKTASAGPSQGRSGGAPRRLGTAAAGRERHAGDA